MRAFFIKFFDGYLVIVGRYTSNKLDSKEQLNELIQVQSMILVDCYKIVKDITFLSNTDHLTEISDIIAGDRFFIRSGNYMWTILVLELNKLFDKRENYTLLKTLNISINEFRKIKWDKNESLDKLKEIKKEIENDKIKLVVENLNYIRDKQIAHLDRNRLDEDILVHLSEAKNLMDFGQKTLSEINWRLNGGGLSLDYDILGLCEITILKLAEYNKIRE